MTVENDYQTVVKKFRGRYINREFAWSIRFCACCGRHTIQRYERVVGHTRCEECGM
jgi:hypothetical protein